MKTLPLLLLCVCLSGAAFSQETAGKLGKIASATVKTLDGKDFNTSLISNNGNPVILSFWALWCTPCMRE
ncbi:MAG: redoxin domain-containing protein, partial [bacterium]|nr:redoxin domain-containing protein [bacterium]